MNDRERALMEIIEGQTPLCPYLFKVPAQGAYGPKTCAGGCREAPCTTSGPYSIFEFEDLTRDVQVFMVNHTLENHVINDDHPAIAWWKEHTGEDLLA